MAKPPAIMCSHGIAIWRCHPCNNERCKAYGRSHRTDAHARISSAKSKAKIRAEKKGVPFNLTTEYLEELYKAQGGRCIISGKEFQLIKGKSPNGPSLDRIIPELGYVAGNVRWVTCDVSCALNEYGFEPLLKLCIQILKHNNKWPTMPSVQED